MAARRRADHARWLSARQAGPARLPGDAASPQAALRRLRGAATKSLLDDYVILRHSSHMMTPHRLAAAAPYWSYLSTAHAAHGLPAPAASACATWRCAVTPRRRLSGFPGAHSLRAPVTSVALAVASTADDAA